ncbi:hypothetical protein ABEB36_005635 [Hypothenemus hampei]|uniref:dolichol kinase n=1 Tax=Hypothenemus hampei TaxID=57062 RepID=A0ABD1EZ11_HYPHA
MSEENANFMMKNSFVTRPNAGNGLWVFLLLPISLIVSSLKHPIILTPTYKVTTTLLPSLICNSAYIIMQCYKNKKISSLNVWSLGSAISSGGLIYFWLHKRWLLSILSSIFTSFAFLTIFKFLLTKMKESFTLGEAGLISQSISVFLHSSLYNIYESCNISSLRSNMQISTLIIQIGLLGLTILSYICYKFDIRSAKTFYSTTFFIVTVTIILPLHVFLEKSPLYWIFNQIIEDVTLLKLFIYWSACCAIAILAVNNQIYYAQKASTSTRKIFHILAVLVFVPGLYLRCCFLYMASGIVLGVFFALEILRLLNIPPLGDALQDGYELFRDEKDSGFLALTPIYLLCGVSLPIWLHPSPCDVTDSAQFVMVPLLSGLSVIGIGDTMASYVGSKIGKHKWRNSLKTIEGTLACVFSQLAFFYFLFYLGLFPYLTFHYVIRIVISVVVGSLVEAKTTQIDNLVLPLIMYILLI